MKENGSLSFNYSDLKLFYFYSFFDQTGTNVLISCISNQWKYTMSMQMQPVKLFSSKSLDGEYLIGNLGNRIAK